MQKREITWIVVLFGLVGAYYYFFGIKPPGKQLLIHASLRPGRRDQTPVYPVYFTLNDDFNLTSVKVVPLDDDGQIPLGTPPVWNLVADGNPALTRAFLYGQHIKGMKSALASDSPDPLTPGVIYRIFVSSGKLTASLNFKTEPTPK
jgi:hypothetical protein